jgi:predicted nucleic acid-binding Zn ribbon protein
VLGTALRRLGVQREVQEVQLREALAEVVGPALSPLCQAVSLQRGTLLVATRNGALAQQLQLEMPTLVRSLNQRLGAEEVKRLRFTALG